jgi:hypothetical protein
MTYIDVITDEHLPILEAKAMEWKAFGLATGATNKEEAREGVIKAYKAAELSPPTYFVYLRSPLAGAISAYVVREMCVVLSEMQRGVRNPIKVDAPYNKDTPLFHTLEETWNQLLPQFMEQEKDEFPDAELAYAEILRHIHAKVAKEGMRWEANPVYGSHDSAWLAFYDTLGELGVPNTREPMEGMMQVAKNAGWWWPLTDFAIITDRPLYMHRDDQNRMHCEDGPAIEYADGWKMWVWHNTIVTQQIIEQPHTLTPEQIIGESNAEIKRIMLERYGFEEFIRNSNAQKVHTDSFGTLWKKDLGEGEEGDDRYLAMVEVVCPSTDRKYMLRVPPSMERARQAVAWTFKMTEAEYMPSIET